MDTTAIDKIMDAQPVHLQVQVGDIFTSSWGYDQVNRAFFQVVELTPSGKSARIRRMETVVVSKGNGWEMVQPVWNMFVGAQMTKRIGDVDGRLYFRICSFEHAWVWDGQPKHQTAWYAGH